MDLADNALVVHGSGQLQNVRSALLHAYDGGAWDLTGISTAITASRGGTVGSGQWATKFVLLGYGDNAVLNKTTFEGESISTDNILVKWTFRGDADLDGDADGVDIGTWATNFTGELGGTGSSVWTQGDWDYDWDVDGVDSSWWAQDFTGELGGGGLRPGGEGGGGSDHIDDPEIAEILQGLADDQVPLLQDWEWLWT